MSAREVKVSWPVNAAGESADRKSGIVLGYVFGGPQLGTLAVVMHEKERTMETVPLHWLKVLSWEF